MKIFRIESLSAFLSRLSKREKIVFYCALCFILLMLLDRLVVFPVYSKMHTLNKEIKEKESDIKRDSHIVAQKDKILAESARFGSFFNGGESEEEEMTSVLKEIEILANKASVYLVDMKPGAIKTMGEFKKYQVNLNCEAQMEQLVNFMYDIENSNKLLTIEKYQMNPKSKESSVVVCNLSISKVVIP